MKRLFWFIGLSICAGLLLATSVKLGTDLEIRGSEKIIWTSRTHDTLTLDTLAYIDSIEIYHKYANLTDSLKCPWIRFSNGGAITNPHADSIKITEANIISDGKFHTVYGDLDSMVIGQIRFDNGAVITNPHTDTAKIDEANILITGNLYPDADTTVNFGSPTKRLQDIWGFRYWFTDPTKADSVKLYDDGDTTRLESDNPIKIDTPLIVAEQWIYEYRVDSIYVPQMDVSNGKDVLLYAPSNEGTELQDLYMQMNANGEFWWYDLDEITCDSARIDSINWGIVIVATNVDTILLGYINPMGGSCTQVNFVTTDTIIKSSTTGCWDTTVVFDQLINKSNKRYFPYCNLLNTSSEIRLYRLILYYKAYNKRYGIPE